MRRSGSCCLSSLQETQTFAYNFTEACHGEGYNCEPESYNCYHRIVEIANWYWEPSECGMHDFDADILDKHLARRKILVLGDSLGVQQFSSLANLLASVIVSSQKDLAFTMRSGATFVFYHVLHLVGSTGSEPPGLDVNLASGWLTEARQADVIVFNTGHHWPKRDETFAEYDTMVHNVLRAMESELKNQHVFFRSSNMGHLSPEQYTMPLNGPYVPEHSMKWHADWLAVKQHETAWQHQVQFLNLSSRFHTLNISFTDARADAHQNFRMRRTGQKYSDFLHYCQPGVPDYWNWLVFHAFLQTVPAASR